MLHEEQKISPYDITLKTMPEHRQRDWANYVIKQMKQEFDLTGDEFIILAGKDYYENLLSDLTNYNLPLGNRSLGERISYLQSYLSKAQLTNSPDKSDNENFCRRLHSIFNASKQYDYTQIKQTPFNNGIYIMFEKNEYYNELKRIVRVGTHTSPNRLKQRLADHFINKSKDNSIFRKNIGRAILNKEKSPYLHIWNLDSRKPENLKYIINNVQSEIEEQITDYLKDNITFTVLEIEDANLRLRLENAIIATLNNQSDFGPSANWLGNYSTEAEIRQSGMWLKIGLDDIQLSQNEIELIEKQLDKNENISLDDISNSKDSKMMDNKIKDHSKTGSNEIRVYINSIFEDKKRNGFTECILVSGDIHKQLKLSNKMPSVCSVMYQLMKSTDEVLRTTPSGKSSTITIRYRL